jgi:hypothetical protein
MDAELAAFDGDVADWVNALPGYQQEIITHMLIGRDPATASLAWLDSADLANTQPFGVIRTVTSIFSDSLLDQIYSLLCGETEYSDERKELIRNARMGRAALVTAASGFIATHLGVSSALIAPAIALTFAILARAGQDSACATLEQLIEGRRSHSGSNPRHAAAHRFGS